MTERVYFSINKLMSYINENKLFDKYIDPINISLWFESNETFVNKFKQVVIKPIAITLKGSDKSMTLTHQSLIDAFDNKQPFVSFSKNKKRSVPKSKSGELSFLSIDMTQKEFEGTASPGSKSLGKKYYPSKTSFTTNKTLVKNILDKKIDEESEEEDYGFEITEFI